MLIQFTDYNNASNLINTSHQQLWAELSQAFQSLPLFIKPSTQAKKIGAAIFDPVGTNAFLCNSLVNTGWQAAYPMPSQFDFLGTDIDFTKNGTLVEVQFSNYPFLVNNVLRAEILYKSKTVISSNHTADLLVLVTKLGVLPASNSTLYYEQAINQLNSFVQQGMVTIPIRVVGLHEIPGQTQAIWTTYDGPSSRTILTQSTQTVQITQRRSGNLDIV